MSKNGLHRHYDRLSAEERFRLDVLATARGDTEESERLTRSCPRRTYTMNEAGFGGRWSGTRELGLRFYTGLGPTLAKLQMVDAFRELVPYSQVLTHNFVSDAYFKGHESGSRHAWSYAGKSGAPPTWPEDAPNGNIVEPEGDERDATMDRDLDEIEAMVEGHGNNLLPELLDALERRLVEEALSYWEGFSAFCRGAMNLSPEKVLKVVVEPGLERVEDLKARSESLKLGADPEITAAVRGALAQGWSAILARGDV